MAVLGYLVYFFWNGFMSVGKFMVDADSGQVKHHTGAPAPTATAAPNGAGLLRPCALALDPAHKEMFVLNGEGGTIVVCGLHASGSPAPLRVLSSPTLTNVTGLLLDQEDLVVVSCGPDAVQVYPRTGTGELKPSRVLQGPKTALKGPQAVALDEKRGQLIVANDDDTLTFYPRKATGDLAPVRILGGAKTGLSGPTALAVDAAHKELIVANAKGNTITVYDLAATGDVAPKRTILGLHIPFSLTLDLAHKELIVGTSEDALNTYSLAAKGKAAPVHSAQGDKTGLAIPAGLAFDAKESAIVVANRKGGTVTTHRSDVSGNTAPIRKLGD